MGCYQEGIAKNRVDSKDVTAHIFEYTSQKVVAETGEVSPGACPVQILFCLKEQNKKKLNSHRWFFNAFGPLINPNGTSALAFPVLYHPNNALFSLRPPRCRYQAHRNVHLRTLEM